MRKYFLLCCVWVMLLGAASADLAIDWTSGLSGAIYYQGGSGVEGPFVENAVVQLIWSTTPAITLPGAYDVAGGLADEWILLQDFTRTYGQGFSGSGIWSDEDVGGHAINSGYFYTRVIGNYFVHPMEGRNFIDIAEYGPGLVDYNASDPTTVYSEPVLDKNYYVVPEPSTLSLLGVCGLFFLFRCRRRHG